MASAQAKAKPGAKDAKRRKEEADMDVVIRFFDSYSRTMEGIRKPLEEMQQKMDELDEAVYQGLGLVEDKVLTQGITEGASRNGIYGVADLIFNSHLQEYFGITKDGELLHFDWTGNTLPAPKPTKPFTRFIHCGATPMYICWTAKKSGFFLAREDWTFVIDAVAIAPIANIVSGGRKSDDGFEFFIISGATLNRYSYHASTNLMTLQDALTLSDIEAEGSSIELTCFDDPKDDRKQWIYCTFGTSCTIIDVTGRVHGTKRNLHRYKITAIAATGGSDFVVTGDDKGLLKIWGQRWAYLGEVQAHHGRITHVIEHPDPFARASISFGKDQKLVVVSFNSLKEIESLEMPEVATRVVVNPFRKGFMTQGPRKIIMWKMNSLLSLRQSTTAPVVRMLLSADCGLPRQVVATCSDNAVQILNAASGQGMTSVLIHPMEPTTRSVAYRRNANSDTLYALVDNDAMLDLQQFDCRANPARLIETWPESKWNVGITCVTFFEHNPKITIAEKELAFTKRRKAKQMAKQFLLCGRRDGCLVIVDIDTGAMDSVTQGHTGSVTYIEIDHQLNQFISLGTLPSLRLWKIGQTEDERLLPLMDVTWKHHPISMGSILRNVIAFVLDHKESNQYKVVMFNTLLAEKFEHDAENGHKKEILSISACRELSIFCTASLDGTLMVRSNKNIVYRVIVLNAIPSCAIFATGQGDIFVGIEKEIYAIPAQKHLSIVARNRALDMGPTPGAVEPRISASSRAVRDKRFQAEEETHRDLEALPVVTPIDPEPDSQQARDLEVMRLINDDIKKIIKGQHPLDPIIPDFHNMSKKEWDDFGKSIYGDDGENRKFFASESRLAAAMKMQAAGPDLDNFANIS